MDVKNNTPAAQELVEDFDRLKRVVALAERARDAVRFGTPGGDWHLSELGYPKLIVEAIAKITPAADGSGYLVSAYTLRGDAISSCVRKTLRGAFAVGCRLAADSAERGE